MRLIILFLMLSVGVFGQEGSITPVTIGTADAGEGDDLYDAFTKVNANDNSLSTEVSTLNTNTTGVSGWTISINATDDSLVFTLGNNVYKVPIGATVEDDITPPTVTAIEVGTLSSDTVVVTFSEVMDTDVPTTGVTLSEDGNNYGLGTWFFSSTTQLKIPLDSTAETGKSYLLTYLRPGTNDFQDVATNKLASFASEQVTNNIASSSSVYAYMLFENDDSDEMSAMTFTWSGTEAYRTTGSPPQGTYSTSASAGAAMSTAETHNLGKLVTFAGWFNGGNDANTSPRYLVNADGLAIWYDYDGATNVNSYLEGTIGGQSFQSTSQASSVAEYKWTHFAVTYDGVNGYARTYINGVNVSSDSVVATDLTVTGTIDIAWDGSGNQFFGDYDDIHFYKAVLTDADILELKNNPGLPIGGRTDPPIPTGDITILWQEDWDDFSVTTTHAATVPTGITKTALSANLTNYRSLDSDDAITPDLANNADIVSFDGSNSLKSWYLEGQCCTNASSQVSVPSNGGTGIDLHAWINADHSGEEEVYISWNQFIYSGFENSWGFKQPGVVNGTTEHATSRLIINDYNSYEFNIGHYTLAYYDSYTYPRNSTSRYDENYDLGVWVNVTLRSYIGTEGSADGLVEIFIDGILISTGLSSRPFLKTGYPGWNDFNISTFMGGAGTEYTSPIDQWIIYDEFVVFQFDAGADVPHGSTPSQAGRDISGTLKSIGDLGFPR